MLIEESYYGYCTNPNMNRERLKKQAVEIPKYKPKVLDAMEEARQISRDPNTKRYGSFAEALEDIDL